MKISGLLTLLALCICCSFGAFSQTVAIYDYLDDGPEPEDISGTVVNAPFGSTIRRFYIDNTAGGSFQFRITRVKIEEAIGAQDYMAFGQSEGVADVFLVDDVSPLDTFTTPISHTLGDLVNGFLASYYLYNGSTGCSQYRYFILNDFDTKLDSVDVRFCSNVGIENHENAALRIYPNPSSNFLLIDFKKASNADYHAVFYDLNGRDVLRTSVIDQSIDISSLPAGQYVLQLFDLTDEHEVLNTQVIIE